LTLVKNVCVSPLFHALASQARAFCLSNEADAAIVPSVTLTSDRTGSGPQPFAGTYSGKRVFVTGHTGFKGAWLCEWLLALGAEVTGYSLPAPTQPALSQELSLHRRVKHLEGDVADLASLAEAIRAARPEFVFHLAAQAIVRESYRDPVRTFSTNVMGTVHTLEALRRLTTPCAAVFVTSDKCYENRNWVYGYREDDPLGGHDPYSASKGAAEVAIASMRRSFFKESAVSVASARAGNVIGGGDWAKDRIVPDCIRSLQAGQAILVRNRSATRPWQHVLEALSGYLWLGACLSEPRLARCARAMVQSAFNFGPSHDANRSVAELVVEVLKHWPGSWEDQSDPGAPKEASVLQLSTDKAHSLLGWAPVWGFAEAIGNTVEWYRKRAGDPEAVQSLTAAQISQYVGQAARSGVPWALPASSTP